MIRRYFQFEINEKVSRKYNSNRIWYCCALGLYPIFYIHWHWGKNEYYEKPKFRLRSFSLFNREVPLFLFRKYEV